MSELTELDIETLAELYVEEMESGIFKKRPYISSSGVFLHIRRDQQCSDNEASDVIRVIKDKYRERLQNMGYELSEQGSDFSLKDEALPKIRGD